MATAPIVVWPFSPDLVSEWPGASALQQRPTHFGTDFAVAQGTPVPASIAGTVVRAGDDGRGAWCIDILSPSGLLVRGGHFSRMDVRVGQQVDPGTIIGLSGGMPRTPGAGLSTGPHYHWELRWDRLWSGGAWVDPRTLNVQAPAAPATIRKDSRMHAIMMEGMPDSGILLGNGLPPRARTHAVFTSECLSLGITPQVVKPDMWQTAVREAWADFNAGATSIAAAVAGKLPQGSTAPFGLSDADRQAIATAVNDDAAKRMQS